MAKFFGVIGFAGTQMETSPGIWEEGIVEYTYFGDVTQNNQSMRDEEKVNPDISLSHTISVVADEYANGHISAMRYISWAGELWSVQSVTVQRPRLLVRLGGVWNGRRPPSPTP